MSSWSPEPGMWVLCQVGLEPGPGAGGGVCCGGSASGFASSGTIRGQRAACCVAAFVCERACHAREQAGVGTGMGWAVFHPGAGEHF